MVTGFRASSSGARGCSVDKWNWNLTPNIELPWHGNGLGQRWHPVRAAFVLWASWLVTVAGAEPFVSLPQQQGASGLLRNI